MSSYGRRVRAFALASAVMVCAGVASLESQSPAAEEQPRRRLESGRRFLREQNYAEALKDFEALLQSYPTSTLADDALLEIATYHLEVARNPQEANAKVQELIKVYPASDSAAMAFVLEGRIALTVGRGPDDISKALASFDRVPRLFPGSEAVPAAIYFGGEAARLGGRREQALDRFSQVATQYPASLWAANALVGSASALVRASQPGRAMEHLDRVRGQFPRTAEAATALDWNSVLYRLYLRAPHQPAFVFSDRTIGSPTGRLRNVVDIAMDGRDNLFVASSTGVTAYGTKGNQTFSVAAPEPRSVAFDRLGNVLTVHEPGLRAEGRTPVTLALPLVDGRARELKLEDAVVTALGDYLVADRAQKVILRFRPGGQYVGDYARQINARRLAINELDEVAALDRDAKGVTIFDRDGAVLKRIPERGTGYQFRDPSDVQFDRLGHVYVLDRAAVYVFAPDGGRLLTTFTPAQRTPAAIGDGKALALDTAGRLHVFDGRTDSVKVYR